MQTLTPDAALLYPLVCRIQTPTGVVDLAQRLPRRGGVTLRQISAEEVASLAQKAGVVVSDPSTCPPESEEATPPGPAGVILRIQTELGAEYGLIRPIRRLLTGNTVSVTECYTDRYTLRLWQNAIVHTPPETPFLSHASGTEFHNITLELLIVGGTP